MQTSFLQELVIGIPISSKAYQVKNSSKRSLPDPACQYNNQSKQSKADSVHNRMINKIVREADSFAQRLSEHVRMGPKITETVKGKLSLGARILLLGGVERVFKQLFSVAEREKLLKASQCYLSTTSGPIAGLLFISNDKVAFCSERSIKITSPKGELVRIHYKVLIPLRKIKCVNQSENVKRPSQKYMEIVTVDNFEFWFMGFLNYPKAFKYLKRAISQA
ncbi:GEM-like protein 4 [Quillaja saponaria]|uniref:GEM-like protein 4 n=1 Tax=Quillaja saponaria TaxID=32244 RepID=A0AAD7LAL9_QUISA|nr:GEM-like protein 4 [Quillaja saponaria]